METKRIQRELVLIIVAIASASLAACSSAPRFTSHPASEEREPPVIAAPSRDNSARGETARNDSARSGELRGDVDTTGDTSDAPGDLVVQRAEDYLGTPYRSGGTGSNGVDCSGLTFAVYRSVGVTLPRSSDDQARIGEPVPRDSLAPGDLIFFGSGSSVSHVGIYAGGGEFIHASTRARSVRFDRLDNKYFSHRYVTARRVL